MTKFLTVPVAALLLLTTGPAVATPTAESAPADDVRAAMETALNAYEQEVMVPGPADPRWSEAGTDLRALVESKPGGTAGNFLLFEDEDGSRSVMAFSPGSTTSLIPADWVAVADIGDVDSADPATDLYIGHLEGPYYAALRDPTRPVGNASCSAGPIVARLYRIPDPEAEELSPEIMKMMFEAVVRRLDKYDVCTRYDADGGAYRLRNFYPDGRSLPKLDESEERVVIVPAAPVETLLGS